MRARAYDALALIVVGVIFGLAGSVTVGRRELIVLGTSGISVIFAAIIFVAGFGN
jgi:hypothetical protein